MESQLESIQYEQRKNNYDEMFQVEYFINFFNYLYCIIYIKFFY
jgi:hypothetical protein